MFNLNESNNTNWKAMSVFKTVKEAFESSNPPFIVEGVLERCSCYASSNYSGLLMVLENDIYPVIYYPTGGINAFQSLTSVGDMVSLRFTKEDFDHAFRFTEDGAVRADNFKNITTRKTIKKVKGQLNPIVNEAFSKESLDKE